MIRRPCAILLVAVVATTVGCTGSTQSKLQGRWTAIESSDISGPKGVEFSGDTLTLLGTTWPEHVFKFVVVPNTTPSGIDLYGTLAEKVKREEGYEGDIVRRCIYELNGDRLRLLVIWDQNILRPTEWVEPPVGVGFLVTLKRGDG